MIEKLAISGYRSIREMIIPLERLNVIIGANGTGKSNLYRALRLLQDTAEGNLISSLAREGGFASVLWAGPETITNEMRQGLIPVEGTLRKSPVSLRLGFLDEVLSYYIDLGLPQPSQTMFGKDPEIKRECLWLGNQMKPTNMIADHRKRLVRRREQQGKWQGIELKTHVHDSMLAAYADPVAAPEIVMQREIIRSWRFYDSFRTDQEAASRRPAPATRTPIMSPDGSNLAAALQTIIEFGGGEAINETIDDAFPGSDLQIDNDASGMGLKLRQPGMLRALTAAELSDGTLKYLLLVAALLTFQPPKLLVLNEPENSLHPDLLPALARLIAKAADASQIILVTHSYKLADELMLHDQCRTIHLQKQLGETVIEGSNSIEQLGWKWPAR